MDVPTKAVVTIAEMARMVGLSRARFYQLIGSGFPWPLYSVATRRPFFDQDLQKVCLEVRHRNCGIDGKPILFYARRPLTMTSSGRAKARPRKVSKHADLIEGLRGLGLGAITEQQIEVALKNLYPNGTNGVSDTEVLRRLFLSIKRQNSADNLGR
jgi:hypothetical protein